MPFDFNALIEDPQFQAGIGIMGASRSQDGLMKAYQILNQQRMQKLKIEEEASQRAMEKEKIGLYRQQVEQSAANTALKQRELEMQQAREAMTQKLTPLIMQKLMQRRQTMMQTPAGVDPTQPQSNGPAQPPKDHFESKILPIEGKRLPDGSWMVSPKGAVGPAQVMPKTGPEAAALAGLPWDPVRFEKDEGYNIAIGKAYHKKQLQDFGNVPMADAAYNAGPQAVRDAMARAKKAGNEGAWLSFLPLETRNYVMKTTGYSGGPLAPQHSMQYLIQQEQAAMEDYREMQEILAMLGLASNDLKAATTALGEATKPDYKGVETQLKVEQGVRDEGKLQDDRTRTGIMRDAETRQAAQEKRIADEKAAEKVQKKSEARLVVEQYDSQMQAMHDTAKNLLNHPGLSDIVGRYNSLLPAQLLTKKGMDALAWWNQLSGMTFMEGTLAIRQASPTGAGVGNQSNTEGDKLQNAKARLNRAQSDAEFKQALREIINLTKKARSNVRNAYTRGWNDTLDLPEVGDASQSGGSVLTYEEWKAQQGK